MKSRKAFHRVVLESLLDLFSAFVLNLHDCPPRYRPLEVAYGAVSAVVNTALGLVGRDM
jgi:hypothetical protein